MIFLFNRLKHYLSVYKGFIETCFIESMNFRLHFFLLILLDIIFYVSSLASIYIIYNHVQSIGGWNREQFMFFVSFMLGINQLTMTFTAESYWRFPFQIRTGELDFVLVKPISSIFSVFFRHIRPGSLLNLTLSCGVITYFGLKAKLSLFAWFILPFVLIGGFLLQTIITMVLSCSMFWIIEGTGINFIRLELQQLARWPDFVYRGSINQFLTIVLPILLVGSAPVRFLFDKNDWLPLAGMGLAIIIFWAILIVLWRLGLIMYDSASS